MPRRKTPVKNKFPFRLRTLGAVDLHFHGAFGIDLMRAKVADLDRLSELLWKNGVAAFCPTTLSVSPTELAETVSRLGEWIQARAYETEYVGAIPLGIHLEGPFINPEACGAHPPQVIRPVDLVELEKLWELSRHTLKILTFAPEKLEKESLKKLVAWAKKRGIILSLGHSRATEAEARAAFDAGVSGVTHAWNALSFHHREPGALGSAMGRKDVYLELILDQIHVAPTTIDWTRSLHHGPLCFVSDCAPAAAMRGGDPGPWTSFGPLQIRLENGASRVAGGHLAGGGLLLPEMYRNWASSECKLRKAELSAWIRASARHLSADPLRALGFSPARLRHRKVEWKIEGKTLSCRPIPA